MTTSQHIGNDDLERMVITNVRDFGWHAVNVIEGDGYPPWTYTIGLYDTWNHPELILIGRSRATAHHILDNIATGLDNDQRLDLTEPSDTLIPGVSVRFIQVAGRYYSDYVGFARWYYRKRNFPVFQIIWPNHDGHYPWSPQASKAFKEWSQCWGSRHLVRESE